MEVGSPSEDATFKRFLPFFVEVVVTGSPTHRDGGRRGLVVVAKVQKLGLRWAEVVKKGTLRVTTPTPTAAALGRCSAGFS